VAEVCDRIGQEFGVRGFELRLHTDGFTHPGNADVDLLQDNETIIVEKMVASARKRKRSGDDDEVEARKQNPPDSSDDEEEESSDDDSSSETSGGQSSDEEGSESDEDTDKGSKKVVQVKQREAPSKAIQKKQEAQPKKKKRNDRWLGKTVTIKKGPKLGLVGIVQEKVGSRYSVVSSGKDSVQAHPSFFKLSPPPEVLQRQTQSSPFVLEVPKAPQAASFATPSPAGHSKTASFATPSSAGYSKTASVLRQVAHLCVNLPYCPWFRV